MVWIIVLGAIVVVSAVAVWLSSGRARVREHQIQNGAAASSGKVYLPPQGGTPGQGGLPHL